MDLMQAIRERRSIRKYRADPVPEEELKAVLEAARLSPSWANTQCWRLVVVRNPDTKAKLAEALTPMRPGGKNNAFEAVRNAPVVIVVCAERGLSGCYSGGDKKGVPATDKGQWWFMFDVGLAMQNLTLAAHTLGMGTVHVGLFDAPAVARILGVPDNVAVVEIVPLGRSDETPPARPRKEQSEFVFYEKYPG